MIANSSNPLLPKNTVASPALKAVETPETTEETTPATDESQDSEETETTPADPEETETEETTEETPAAPAQAATPTPKLSAFDRGALRMLGKGDLVARLESSEATAGQLRAEVNRLTAENQRLSALQAETPHKIADAAKLRENDITKGVASELAALGVTQAAAPSQIGAEATPEALLEKFQTLQGAEKTAFWRANKTALKAAEAAQ